MKFSADLSLSVPILAGYFTTSFSSNFKNLSAQCDNKSKCGSILGELCTALDKMGFFFPMKNTLYVLIGITLPLIYWKQ